MSRRSGTSFSLDQGNQFGGGPKEPAPESKACHDQERQRATHAPFRRLCRQRLGIYVIGIISHAALSASRVNSWFSPAFRCETDGVHRAHGANVGEIMYFDDVGAYPLRRAREI